MKFFSKYVVVLTGGIGNQLFQYSYAKYLQAVEHKNVVVYFNYLGNRYDRTDIISEVDPGIYLSNNIIAGFLEDIFQGPNSSITTKIIRKCVYLILFSSRYTETHDYTKYIKDINKMGLVIMGGWWQSAEMVNAVKDEIKDIILQKQITSKDYTDIARRIDSQNNSVAVHIRDFDQSIDHPQQTLSKGYYQKAINKHLTIHKDTFFFIFSDDNSEAHKMLEDIIPSDKYLLVPNAEDVQKDYEALILMSRCKHFIMSNSTFGWWGAWLSWAHRQPGNKDAIYYMPSRWDNTNKAEERASRFIFSPQCILLDDTH